MTTRSMLGQQPLKKSAPAYGFGAASRETASKVFVSQEMTALATAGKASPAKFYLLPPSVGGTQPDGRRANPPSWGFGSANRFRPMSAPAVPGPGHYSMPPGAAGNQTNSRYSTMPQYGFGTGTRAHAKKVFVSQEHQKTDSTHCSCTRPGERAALELALNPRPTSSGSSFDRCQAPSSLNPSLLYPRARHIAVYGLASPGPFARYEFAPSVGGVQPESKTQTMPSWKMGGGRHDTEAKARASPGPAAYTLPQSVGPQPDSRKARSGTPSFGSGSRDKRALVYLGPNHDKGMFGRGSPYVFALPANSHPDLPCRLFLPILSLCFICTSPSVAALCRVRCSQWAACIVSGHSFCGEAGRIEDGLSANGCLLAGGPLASVQQGAEIEHDTRPRSVLMCES